MKIEKFTSSVLLAVFSLSLGCNNISTDSVLIPENQLIGDFQTFDNSRVTTDDSDIAGDRSEKASLSQKKLVSENISTNSSFLTFKTVVVKKGKGSFSSLDSEKLNVSGKLNFYDDKGNLKAGANIAVNLLSGGKQSGSAITDETGFWSISLDKNEFSGKTLNSSFQFSNKYWIVSGKSNAYTWEGPLISNLTSDYDTGTLAPVKDTENAKAAFIHDIYNRYLNFFKKEGVDVNPWWKKQIKTVWPMNANYYSWGTVNLTDADHWDVNGHEIAHAMTAIGTNSDMGGGQHKIDECYTEDLAWSEGFASFLSGAITLDKNDPDAKFEFLVPRRAPIRMENVPDDVCKGQKNEWRVSAALWDIYDSHTDGEDSFSLPFKTLWSSLSRKERKIGSMKDAANSIKELTSQDIYPALDSSLKQNTMF